MTPSICSLILKSEMLSHRLLLMGYFGLSLRGCCGTSFYRNHSYFMSPNIFFFTAKAHANPELNVLNFTSSHDLCMFNSMLL